MGVSSIRLGFVRGRARGAIRVRYAEGAAPRRASAGRAALVQGQTAVASTLKAGTRYGVSVFTRSGRRWVGPVSILASTLEPAGAAQSDVFVTRPDTVLVDQNTKLTTSEGDGALRSSVPPGVRPFVGQVFVLPTTQTLPGGFVGTVRTVADDGRSMTLVQASLRDAFDYLDVSLPAIRRTGLGPTPATGRSFRQEDSASGPCDLKGEGRKIALNPSFDFDGAMAIKLATKSFLGAPVSIGVQVDARAVFTVDGAMDIDITASLACEKKFADVLTTFMAGPVPIMVRFAPKMKLSASGTVKASNVGVRVSNGFDGSVYYGSGLGPAVRVSGSPVFSVTPLTPVATAFSGEIGAELAGELAIGPGVGTKAAGVQAGISGKAALFKVTATGSQDTTSGRPCTVLRARGEVSAAAFAKAWIGPLSVEGDKRFIDEQFDYGGPWTAPLNCDKPGWTGFLELTETHRYKFNNRPPPGQCGDPCTLSDTYEGSMAFRREWQRTADGGLVARTPIGNLRNTWERVTSKGSSKALDTVDVVVGGSPQPGAIAVQSSERGVDLDLGAPATFSSSCTHTGEGAINCGSPGSSTGDWAPDSTAYLGFDHHRLLADELAAGGYTKASDTINIERTLSRAELCARYHPETELYCGLTGKEYIEAEDISGQLTLRVQLTRLPDANFDGIPDE